MTTLKDLSRALGLSVTQISRALNDHADVSDATKDRVRKVANDLNYQPNMSARRLVTGRSGLVALVLSQVPKYPEDRLFLDIVGAISSNFSRRGLQFILHIADPNDDVVSVYKRLVSGGGIDGFVVLEPKIGDRRLTYLQRAGVPFVLHGRDTLAPDYGFFDIDNWQVGYELTKHLLQNGHERIAFLNGSKDRTYVQQRTEGFMRALAEAGVPQDPDMIRYAPMDEGFGLLETVRLFDRPGPKPTALIAGNIWIAKGIYRSLTALGLKVGKDVSVVAHDDMFPEMSAAAMGPALTCTESPLSISWEPLAEILSSLLDGVPVSQMQMLEDITFVERDSVHRIGPSIGQNS